VKGSSTPLVTPDAARSGGDPGPDPPAPRWRSS